jgi:hypothetical protein
MQWSRDRPGPPPPPDSYYNDPYHYGHGPRPQQRYGPGDPPYGVYYPRGGGDPGWPQSQSNSASISPSQADANYKYLGGQPPPAPGPQQVSMYDQPRGPAQGAGRHAGGDTTGSASGWDAGVPQGAHPPYISGTGTGTELGQLPPPFVPRPISTGTGIGAGRGLPVGRANDVGSHEITVSGNTVPVVNVLNTGPSAPVTGAGMLELTQRFRSFQWQLLRVLVVRR